MLMLLMLTMTLNDIRTYSINFVTILTNLEKLKNAMNDIYETD